MKMTIMKTAFAHTALTLTLVALPVADSIARSTPKSTQAWWPTSLDLTPLRQNERGTNPLGADFDYAADFARLDLEAIKIDINATLTTSQPWWPADYGNTGLSSFAWRGTVLARIALLTAAAGQTAGNSALSH